MTGLGMTWFLLWGLSGGFSIFISAGLLVPATVEMQTRLSTIFEDSPERLQSSGSSPGLVPKKDSSPFPVHDHSSTAGFGIERTSSPESFDPTFESATRGLISRPAEPPEATKNSIRSTLVPIQSQKTLRETSSPVVSDPSSLASTLDPQEPPTRTSSIPWSKGNSTPVPIQKDDRPTGFGTTGGSATASLKPLNLSTTRSPISSPEPFKPSSSSSVPESTTVPIQGFGTTGNPNRTSYTSTAEPPRTSIQSTLDPIQSHKTPTMTSLTSTFTPTSLILKPAEPTRTNSTTKSTRVPPGLGTTQKTSLTSNTDLTRLNSTPEPPRSPPVTSPSSLPDSGPTIRTDTYITSQDGSATRSLSSGSASSASPATARTPAPCAPAKTPPPIPKEQSCSPRGVVKPCLVTIACLAAFATAFMVSTIVLCAKLSTRKYKLRTAQDQTEMTFMSALLPDRSYAGARPRGPASNGVLVIHSGGDSNGDSDGDISDNLTLSSFFPESDRSWSEMKLVLDNWAEGSTDLEEPDNVTPSTTPLDRRSSPPDLLSQVADFLRDHMVLVLVAASLVLIVLLVVCGAVYLTRRRKFNAYFPSSYPAKMYVDQQDKSGGASGFYEIPEKETTTAAAVAASDRERGLTDSHQQLHADIMRVAKSLRTPTKTLEDASKKETASPSPVAGKAGDAIGPPAGGAAAEKPDDESQEAPTSRNVRPPSLHLHNDSATLQLIAGEKTAF
ncbi:uncharacterized protein LOC144034081 [Vanacampus margaritifer]